MGRLKAGQKGRKRSGRAGEAQDQTVQGPTGTQPALALPELAERGTQVHWVSHRRL